jgi:uncharacterized membrane protein
MRGVGLALLIAGLTGAVILIRYYSPKEIAKRRRTTELLKAQERAATARALAEENRDLDRILHEGEEDPDEERYRQDPHHFYPFD